MNYALYNEGQINACFGSCQERGICMKLREYEYILAIAREKNMIRAAQYLCVSQPALSRLLTSVEAEIGAQLFRRCGREMVPTEAGKVYLDNAQRIVELNESFESRMKQVITGRNQITIGCPAIRSDFMIRNVMVTLKREMPEVFLEIKSASQQSVISGISNGEYQLAFGIVDDECERNLSYRLIGTEEMVLVVPKGHPLIDEAVAQENYTYPRILPVRLARETFVMSRANAYSSRFAQYFFQANGIEPDVSARLPLTSMLIPAVADGMGIAIVPSIPLQNTPYEKDVCYLSIRDNCANQAVGVLFRKNRVLSSDEERLIQLMRRAYRTND